jgi:hypothetical protein
MAPVAPILSYANVLVVNKDLPFETIPELIAFAKANPGRLTFGSAGMSASNHLSGELRQVIEAEALDQRLPQRAAVDQRPAVAGEGADLDRAGTQAPELVAGDSRERADERRVLRLGHARQRWVQQGRRNVSQSMLCTVRIRAACKLRGGRSPAQRHP